jgi:hypothetical protein
MTVTGAFRMDCRPGGDCRGPCEYSIDGIGVDATTGHRPFSELTRNFAPERRARVATKAARLREAMTLEELRRARAPSQEDMAETLAVGLSAVAKLEKRTDMHVSNLRRCVEALGGPLEITVRFPDASVVLTNIGEGPP